MADRMLQDMGTGGLGSMAGNTEEGMGQPCWEGENGSQLVIVPTRLGMWLLAGGE